MNFGFFYTKSDAGPMPVSRQNNQPTLAIQHQENRVRLIAVSESNDILKKYIFYFGQRVSVGTFSQSGCGVEKWL